MTDNQDEQEEQDEQDVEMELPLHLDCNATPKESQFEQHVADIISGEKTTMHDVMYGKSDSSEAPEIESIPQVTVEYRVDEDGDVTVSNVVIEDEVVYSSGI